MSNQQWINITKNTSSICKLKCSYSFAYGTTNLQVSNHGIYLVWQVDDTNTPPVIYNDDKYKVTYVILIKPSLHTYSGARADAELLIIHQNTSSTKQLYVCIPIMISSTATGEAVTFFDLILTEVGRTANNKGNTTVFNNPTFSLDKFVPMQPFFSYNGDGIDFVVFHKDNAINMSSEAMEMFKQVCPDNFNIPTGTVSGGLFYNASGPVPPNAGEIYIDCQPTGDDGELLVNVKPESGGVLKNDMLKKLANYTLFKVFMGAIVMILIWKLASKTIKGIAESTKKITTA